MRKSVRERAKIEKNFYLKLFTIFLLTNFIGFGILVFTWFQLIKYEASTPSGAIRSYLKLIENQDFETVYEESKLVFAQFNSKDEYSNHLKEIYQNKNLKEATFAKQSYSNAEFSYYNINIDQSTIATVQLKKDGNKYHIRTLTSVWNFKFDVADNVHFSINNVFVDDGYISENDVKSNAFSDLIANEEVPDITRYHLDNFINIPSIEVEDNNYLAVKDFIADQFYIGKIPVGEQKEELYTLIQKTSETYSKYITEDETFNNLRKLLNRKTKFYEGIASFNNGWYSYHDSVDFVNTKIYDVIMLSENAFIGTIKYDYQVIADKKIQNYPTTNQLFFLKENNKWLCTNIISAR